jgi:hypothetical protein
LQGVDIDFDYPFTCYQRYGTIFIDSGAILNMESRLLVFVKDSDILQIKAIDHRSDFKDFIKVVRLSKKVKF